MSDLETVDGEKNCIAKSRIDQLKVTGIHFSDFLADGERCDRLRAVAS